MRKTKSIILASLFALLFVGLYSCDNFPTGDDTSGTMLISNSEYTIPDLDNSSSTLIDATIDNDFQLVEPEIYGFNGGKNDRRPGDQKRKQIRKRLHDPFRNIIADLNLTEEQLATLKELVASHQDCIKEALLALRASEQEIMEPFRTEREALVAQFRAEELTREEFFAAMQELNIRVREALQNNGARVRACYALNDCRQAFYDAITRLLQGDEEQLRIWNQWLEAHPLRPCEETTEERG
jgi:hypothetical protein